VDIYYKGYHTILEGKFIFDAIKLHINKYRLTTNTHLLKNTERISILEIDNLLSKLYLSESPYEIKQGIRYYRNTNKLVAEATKITVIDSNNNKTIYNSMSECAQNLGISRTKIKYSLDSGKSYKGFIFIFN
jgi:response regulator of citrate/malate metabolism